MATTFYNDTRSNTAVSIAEGNTLVFGTSTFWTMSSSTSIVTLQGLNLLRNAGQVYADMIAVVSLSTANRIENLATGVISSSSVAAISLTSSNSVVNAGYIAGREAILFSGGGNSVYNSGTLVGERDAIGFGGGGSDEVVNSGTIISTSDDAIVFGGFVNRLDNTGLISAISDSAIVAVAGVITIVNSGTITGLAALSLGLGADTVINSGTLSGTVFLGSGDDLFDSTEGLAIGEVFAGSGDDTLIGSSASDQFFGEGGDDLLIGNGGNDRLSGGTGMDEIDGGDGRDTALYADGPVIVDLADLTRNTGEATGDLLISIENLTGSAFADELYGDAGRNVLRGGPDVYADILDGRGGADRMFGGGGSDRYFVDDARDRVVELINEGIDDLVRSSVSFTLAANVENLTLTGNAAIDGIGNTANNAITGNGAANTLDGGLGFDVLVGGGGADIFRFTTALGSANADIVDDFAIGTDKLALSRAVFTELNGGSTLVANRFTTGSAAQDASDRIIYDPASGGLFYDADGTGAIAQILFAGLNEGLALTAADFVIIA